MAKVKIRQSNLELLRTVAMLFVLIVHINGALIYGDYALIEERSWQCLLWSIVESITICCVNIFVLISGWFGIHPSLKGLLSFLFQIAFFLMFCFIVACLLGITSIMGGGLLSYFLCMPGDWFTKSYLLLYLLSPILNSFIDSAKERTFRFVLIGFYLLQSFWGWYWGACDFFKDGYSTISFIGLYLLAAYSRRYLSSISSYLLIVSILGCMFVNALCSYIFDPMGNSWTFLLMNYLNPLVIIQSLSLVILFSRLNFQNRVVNWMAISCYAVYLTHKSIFFFDQFGDYSRALFSDYDGIVFTGVILLFISTVFFSSILLDKVRLMLWNRIISPFYNK